MVCKVLCRTASREAAPGVRPVVRRARNVSVELRIWLSLHTARGAAPRSTESHWISVVARSCCSKPAAGKAATDPASSFWATAQPQTQPPVPPSTRLRVIISAERQQRAQLPHVVLGPRQQLLGSYRHGLPERLPTLRLVLEGA